MELFRVHAFSVRPRRTSEIKDKILGGPIAITPQIRTLIEENIEQSDFPHQSEIGFNFSGSERSNHTRDLIISYGYDKKEISNQSAIELADKLSHSMDRRSKPTLFLIASKKEDDVRQISLWTFPSDTAYKLEIINDEPILTILTDVFSQTSILRKAVLYEGRRAIRSDFISGMVIDNQSTGIVSSYWMRLFLESDFLLREIMGTRVLAVALIDTFNALDDPYEQEKVFASIMGVQYIPQEAWSFMEFADRYFDGKARKEFLKQMTSKELLTERFTLNREEFQSRIGTKVFFLGSGVRVVAPLGEIGESVRKVDSEEGFRLECSGIIEKEKVRKK